MTPQDLMHLVTSRATLDLVMKGVTVGVLVRAVFGLRMSIEWAALAGVFCLLFGPAISVHLGIAWPAVAPIHLILGGGLLLAVLGIGELVRS